MKRWIAFLPLIALAALAVLFVGWSLKRDPDFKPAALVGKPVPAAPVVPLDGSPPTQLRTLVRGPALINVWASWCAPCRIEHPELMRLKGQGVRVIGVAWKDRPENSRKFLRDLGDPFAAAASDRSGQAGIELGISGVPETYAVDARGVIVAKHSGPLTRADAERLVRAMRR